MAYTKEALFIALPLEEKKVHVAQKHMKTAIQILQVWGIDSEEKLNAFLEE